MRDSPQGRGWTLRRKIGVMVRGRKGRLNKAVGRQTVDGSDGAGGLGCIPTWVAKVLHPPLVPSDASNSGKFPAPDEEDGE